MKKLLTSIACLLMAAGLRAQTTVYTGTIKDLALKPVTSGQVTFTLAPSTDSTLPGTGRFTPSTVTCSIKGDGTLAASGSGVGACTVTSNTALSPAGTSYRICIQPQFATPGSCFFDYATTATKDISTVAPTLPTGPLNFNGVPGPPLDFLGTWSVSTTYALGKMVVFNNTSYISLANQNLGNTPSTSPASWSLVQPLPTIIPSPSATQTVIQPTSTTLAVNSLNGALNASLFSGADIGAKVNAAFASCSSTCLVTIPPGTYTYSTTITMSKLTQSLVGGGSAFTILNYTGTGDAVVWQMNPFSVQKAGTLKGFTFVCTVAATNCIHSGSITGSTWEDLVVTGATKTGAAGILLENATVGGNPAWTERTYMHNVHLVSNTRGLDFRINGGTNSYGYSDFDIWLNVGAGEIGIDVEAGASPYHSTFVARGNIDAEPATFISVAGPMVNDNVFIAGETVGNTLGSVVNDIVVTSTGSVTASGSIMVANSIGGIPQNNLSPPNIAPGAIYKVGAFTDFNFPGGSNFASSQTNVIMKAAHQVNADGTIQIASGGSALVGRFLIEWPNTANRYDAMTVDVSCEAFEGQPCLLSTSNYAFGASTVFSNPQLFRDSAGVLPYLTVDVGNRNGVSQNVIVTWIGSALNAPNLFPSGTLSASPQATSGSTQTQSQTTFNAIQVGAGAIITNTNVLPQVGTPNVGQASCIKALGPPVLIGFCSTAVSSGGACTCN